MFQPPEGKIILVIGQDRETIEQYIKTIKVLPSGFMLYSSIKTMEGFDKASDDYGAGIHHASAILKKYPYMVVQVGLYMVGALKDTYRGVYDTNIQKLASWLRQVNGPVYLRIGYEFDYPDNHYHPLDYQKAYCYIVDRLRAFQVKNAAYVWHSFANPVNQPLRAWYPGDRYVDWVSFSYFDQPVSHMIPVIHFAKKQHKPVMIGEATPKGIGTSQGKISWELWFKTFWAFIKKYDIKFVSYINSHWEAQPMWQGQNWKDARIQANSYIKKMWKQEIIKDRCLTPSLNGGSWFKVRKK